MLIGSLFSGIGGLELGIERAGVGSVAWQCEIDPYARAVLAKHWPDAIRFEDVTKMTDMGYLDSVVKTFYDGPMSGKLRKLTPEQAAESVAMYERGLALGPIAKYFGVSRQAMWDLIRRRTTMRPQKRDGDENHFHRGGSLSDTKAQHLVASAVRSGTLVPHERCETCHGAGKPYRDGRRPIQAHHDDYNKPLDVRWLCMDCHHEWHRHNKPKRKEVNKGIPRVDVICGGFP